MKGFYIYVKNDLLEPKHYKNMGKAVWLYLWLLDKMTSVNENGIGRVLGGRPITHDDMYKDLGIPRRNYQRYVSTLRDCGYINTIRTSKGFVITVTKANKVFGQKANDKNGTSLTKQTTKSVQRCAKNVAPNDKNGTSIYRQDSTRQDNRGKYSKEKEKIREAIQKGNLKSLNK